MKLTMHSGSGSGAFSLCSGTSGLLVSNSFCPGEAGKIGALFVPSYGEGLRTLVAGMGPAASRYAAKGAAALLKADAILDGQERSMTELSPMVPRKKIRIGNFGVTPHLVDLFAFDALALSVEAEGKKVFFSLDSRGHYRRSSLFKRVTAKPPEQFDCLVISGRPSVLSGASTDKMAGAVSSPGKVVLIRIERGDVEAVADIYRECRSSGRILVMGLREAFSLSLLRNISDRIPQPHWPGVRVRFSGDEAEKIQAAGYRELVHFIGSKKIDVFEVRRKQARFVFLAESDSMEKQLIKDIGDESGRIAIEYVSHKDAPSNDELKELISAMRPKSVISGMRDASAISSPAPVTVLADGESVEV